MAKPPGMDQSLGSELRNRDQTQRPVFNPPLDSYMPDPSLPPIETLYSSSFDADAQQPSPRSNFSEPASPQQSIYISTSPRQITASVPSTSDSMHPYGSNTISTDALNTLAESPQNTPSQFAPSKRKFVADHEDSSTGQQKRRRRRQALSCTSCREKKIKCDRMHPCAPCTKRGEEDQCHWTILLPSGAGGETSTPLEIQPIISTGVSMTLPDQLVVEKYVLRSEYNELKADLNRLEATIQTLLSKNGIEVRPHLTQGGNQVSIQGPTESLKDAPKKVALPPPPPPAYHLPSVYPNMYPTRTTLSPPIPTQQITNAAPSMANTSGQAYCATSSSPEASTSSAMVLNKKRTRVPKASSENVLLSTSKAQKPLKSLPHAADAKGHAQPQVRFIESAYSGAVQPPPSGPNPMTILFEPPMAGPAVPKHRRIAPMPIAPAPGFLTKAPKQLAPDPKSELEPEPEPGPEDENRNVASTDSWAPRGISKDSRSRSSSEDGDLSVKGDESDDSGEVIALMGEELVSTPSVS